MKDIWIQTVSSKRVNLPIPKMEQIDIEDIAYSLSMKCRFNGHTNRFYSVAEHSIRVSELVIIRLKLAALLHDANEAYLPDIPRPVKELLPEYKKIESLMEEAIYKKYGIVLNEADRIAIKRADNIMLATEGRDLMGNTKRWGLTELPLPDEITSQSPLLAERNFLNKFEYYRITGELKRVYDWGEIKKKIS